MNVFDNIKRVEFHERDYDRILAIVSKEGERIVLDKYVMALGNVEEWLNNLLKMSHQSVHTVIRQANIAINDPGFDAMEFLGSFPAQVLAYFISEYFFVVMPLLFSLIICLFRKRCFISLYRYFIWNFSCSAILMH